MKNFKHIALSTACAAAMSVGLATTASAEFVTVGTVTIDKDIFRSEIITKTKFVNIFVNTVGFVEGAAEADAAVNQENVNNNVTHIMGETQLLSFPLALFADILGSVNDNQGIIQVNQDVGNFANQGNVAAIALTLSLTAVADAVSSVGQNNADNVATTDIPFDPDFPSKVANIIGSINDNVGIVHVNQNTGNMNNQVNVTTLAIADGAAVALADASLGQFNTGNRSEDTNTVKSDLIEASMNNNMGIVNVNQSTGNMNNQATVVSFAGIASLN